MSTKKLSDERKEIAKNIEVLKTKVEIVKNKIKTNKQKKFDKKIAVLEESRNEIQNRVDIENKKLPNTQRKIRVVEEHVDINPFDFKDIDQKDDENNVTTLLDLAEKNETKYDRTPAFDIIVDSQGDDVPFILNGDFFINDGGPFQIIRFFKDSDHLTKSIEKMIDKFDESLEVSFLGYIKNNTMLFKQIRRSNYRKGSDAFNNILEFEEKLVIYQLEMLGSENF